MEENATNFQMTRSAGQAQRSTSTDAIVVMNAIWIQLLIANILPLNMAVVLSYIPSLVIAYYLNSDNKTGTMKFSFGGVVKFFLSYLPNLLIHYTTFAMLFNVIHLSEMISVIASAIISIPLAIIVQNELTPTKTDIQNLTGRPSVKKNSDKIAVCILLATMAACIVHCCYGFAWTDESYYVAVTKSIIDGERMFVDIWTLQQLSNLITAPLVWLYTTFFGTTGIILFMRLTYTVSLSAVAIYMYSVLRKDYGSLSACVCSMILIMFAPTSLATFSYNTMLLMFSALAFSLLVDALRRPAGKVRSLLLIMFGISYALAVQSYPSFALSLLIPIICIVIGVKRKSMRLPVRDWLYMLSGVLVICVIVGVYLQATVSLKSIIEYLPYSLSDGNHTATTIGSYFEFLFNFIDATRVVPLVIILVYSVAAGIVWFAYRSKLKDNLQKKESLRMALLIVGMLLCIAFIFMKAIDNTSVLTSYAIWTTLLGLAAIALADFKLDKTLILYTAGLVAYVAVDMGTNNDGNFSVYPMILSTMAMILYVQRMHFAHKEHKTMLQRIAKLTAIGVCVLVVVVIGYSRLSYLYRDEVTPNMVVMTEGPAAGIKTDVMKDARNTILCKTIKENVHGETVMFAPRLPAGYLMVDGKVGSLTVWGHEFTDERQLLYYKVHPEKIPDSIFIVAPGYGYGNNTMEKSGELWDYIVENDYVCTKFSCGTLYERK